MSHHRRTLFLTIGALAFLVSALSLPTPLFAAPSATPRAGGLKPWTFMIFMAADNNLEASAESDMNELETVGSNNNVNIVVQLDRLGKEAFNGEEKWSGCKRFYIQKDAKPKKVTSPIVQDLGELDMATPDSLLGFVKWVKATYPAQRYAIILWNHGTGWKEISPDFGMAPPPEPAPDPSNSIQYNISYDDTSGSSMDIPTLGTAMKKAAEILGRKFDLIGFDACLMQMAEVAHEISDAGLYQVAAPDREPDRGWPYDEILGYLAANPGADGKKLGEKIISVYKASYQMGSQGNTAVILSLIDLSKTQAFLDKVQEFAKAVKADIAEIDKIEKARQNALKYVYEDYLDLENFLRALIAQGVSPALKKAATGLISAISGPDEDRLIVMNGSTGDKFKNCGGLVVFFPERSGFRTYKKRYKLLEMSNVPGTWFDFLEEYESPNLAYLKITDAILDDQNHDGKIAPGESVKMKLVMKNFGKIKAARMDLACVGPKEKVEFKTPGLKITNTPAPGKESTIEGLEFTVSPEAAINSEVPLQVTISGDKIPVSTFQTTFFIKSGFVTSGHVLLIFADNFSPGAPVLQSMFNTANIKYDLWDRMLDGNIKPEVLKRYLDGWVYLSVQDSSNQQQLLPEETTALTTFLKSGGKLVLSGQDLAFSLRETPFLKDLCKVTFIQDDTNVLVVTGTNGFAKGASHQIYGGDGANNQKWPDEIDAKSGAKLLFKYDAGARDLVPDSELSGPDVKPGAVTRGIKSSGGAAVSTVDGYRVLFFAFGVESLSTSAGRTSVMKEISAFMNPGVDNQIRDYARASSRRPSRKPRRTGREIEENMDMLKVLETRITREIKNSLDKNPDQLESALQTIEGLPAADRIASQDLEKDLRSLLEFQRQHGTVNPR